MDSDQRTLVVVGVGEAAGSPDQCFIDVAFEAVDETPVGALEKVATVANEVIRVLKEGGSAPEDLQTKTMRVGDQYEPPSHTLVGREASYQLTVRTKSVEDVGPLLTAVADVAGNALQILGIRLALSDSKALEATARRRAVDDATQRASQLAESAGVRIGPILSINEGAVSSAVQRMPRAMPLSASPASASIESGELGRMVAVTITYAIEG